LTGSDNPSQECAALTPETLASRRAELLPGLVRHAELMEDLMIVEPEFLAALVS
jgi:hypothetical protein